MSQETKPSLYGHIYFVDILRGWLILLVTYGHTIQAIYGGRETVFSDPVFQTIYMFHMPLFMAISGFVLCRVKFSGSSRKKVGQN
jgi:fucose 4-O-acetylase-like acetyltransferase